MNASTKSPVKSLLHAVAWLLFAIAALVFLFGGRAIGELAKTEWLLAEMEGIGLAALLAGLGVIAKVAEDRYDEGKEDGPATSLGESLRK
jgi:hypothetical protein